jgi:alkylation response protein AidB-like acyl-CoA dehydrogenase
MSTNEIRTESAIDLGSLRDFVRAEVIPNANAARADSPFPERLYRRLHELGWLQAFVPRELGGSGVSTLDMLCICRELGYGSTGVFSSTIVNMLALTPILLHARPELRQELAREFTSRFFLWSYAMTEADTGSNIAATKTVARPVAGGYRLSGRKAFITNAGVAEKLVTFAQVMVSGKPRLTCFYVPGDAKGVTRGKPLAKLGQHDSNTSEVYFDDVFVPEAHRIGEEGAGLKIAFQALQRSKTMIAGAGVGLCRRAFELVTAHLAARTIFPKPLLSFSAIRNQLAELETRSRAAWLLACDAAQAWDNGVAVGDPALRQASMAKAFGADTTVTYAEEVLELFGGYGFTEEFEISRLYRDCKVLEIYEGPTLVQNALIARTLFAEQADLASRTEKKAA